MEATITLTADGWAFQYGKFTRTYPSRDEAIKGAEDFSDETGESFVLQIEKAV